MAQEGLDANENASKNATEEEGGEEDEDECWSGHEHMQSVAKLTCDVLMATVACGTRKMTLFPARQTIVQLTRAAAGRIPEASVDSSDRSIGSLERLSCTRGGASIPWSPSSLK